MKYGTHAAESPETIINNKLNEIELCGKTYWGYGGIVCHPSTQINPFVKVNKDKGEKTYLVLSRINTTWHGNSSQAHFYSINNYDWEPLSVANAISGSKYAIVCKTFAMCTKFIDLSFYKVPFGNSKGRILSEYIFGQNTKACGIYVFPERLETTKILPISAIAEVDGAVFVR